MSSSLYHEGQPENVLFTHKVMRKLNPEYGGASNVVSDADGTCFACSTALCACVAIHLLVEHLQGRLLLVLL